MSLLPLIFGDTWARPPHYEFHPDEMLVVSKPRIYLRPWVSAAAKKDSGSTITSDKDKFQAHLDVQQFSPDEISVKVSGSEIVIEGKHEEKQDEHGSVARHFVRRYILPDHYDIQQVRSELSADGVLSITAPKVDPKDSGEKREIPIQQTGKPAKIKGPVEQKQEEKKTKTFF